MERLQFKTPKKAIFDQFQLEKEKLKLPWDMKNPDNLRLRDMTGNSPKNVYSDFQTVKDLGKGYVYSTSEVCVQNLPNGETETKEKDEIVFFLQQFFPQDYTLGERWEFKTTEEELLVDLRTRISEKTGIKNIGLAQCSSWSGPELLNIPKLAWNKHNSGYMHSYFAGKVRSLALGDGELVMFQDMDAMLAELTPEQQKKLKAEDEKKRNALHASRSHHHHQVAEAKLVIHQKDVQLS